MRQLGIVVVMLVCLSRVSECDLDANETTAVEQQFFINELFEKYGDEGVMSFEGFEHLLESLGLGRLEFAKEHSMEVHRINGTFREVHDDLELHHHEHPRRRRGIPHDHSSHGAEGRSEHSPPVTAGRCLSPQDMLSTFGLEPHHAVVIDAQRFLRMCPALVYELDQRACYLLPTAESTAKSDKAWLWATLSVLTISLVGLLGVAVVPLIHRAFFQPCIQFLVALAVGTLVGDALLHLLPHALLSADHHTAVWRSAVAFLALIFFYLVEIGVRALLARQSNSKLENQMKDGFSPEVELDAMLKSDHQHGHSHGASGVGSVAWMVIMGDGLHNLTDGLAIGAAFSADTVAGLATSLAVFCHELPHEIGDLAVLLSAGMSVKRALMYNVFSSVLSFIGMAAGLWLGDFHDASPWIYAFTAGTFLYISLADLVPELAGNASTAGMMPAQLAGMLVGAGIMLVIALYEDSLATLLDTHWLE